jgi:drug/metabolite transporter (DMT)-like permease
VARRHPLMLLALAAIWGASFMFIKVAARELSPSAVVTGRVLLAHLDFCRRFRSCSAGRERGESCGGTQARCC